MSVELVNHGEIKTRSILSWKDGEKRTTTGGQHQSGLASHREAIKSNENPARLDSGVLLEYVF